MSVVSVVDVRRIVREELDARRERRESTARIRRTVDTVMEEQFAERRGRGEMCLPLAPVYFAVHDLCERDDRVGEGSAGHPEFVREVAAVIADGFELPVAFVEDRIHSVHGGHGSPSVGDVTGASVDVVEASVGVAPGVGSSATPGASSGQAL